MTKSISTDTTGRNGWLRFFRIVNLPTVPGDVLVGATAVLAGRTLAHAGAPSLAPSAVVGAALASCALYLFGLADNDLVGAKTDGADRPIPSGAISLRAARSARALCLFAALIVGAAFGLPCPWLLTASLLCGAIVLYNRTKLSVLMGLCRGLNVLCGGFAVAAGFLPGGLALLVLVGVSFVWTLYITAVTLYSRGEETDPAKRRRVGLLVGAIVYLQLGALLYAYFLAPCLPARNLLLAGAALLVALRLMKRAFPKVSAS